LIARDDATLIVADLRGGHVFGSDGRYRHTWRPDSAAEAFNEGLHLAALGSGVVAGVSGKFKLASDSAKRVNTRLHYLPDPGAPRAAGSVIATIPNGWSVLPAMPRGFPGHRPYRDAHRRTWATFGSSLITYSFEAYHVRVDDVLGARAPRVYGVVATPPAVDESERVRVMREQFGSADRPVPFLRQSARAVYAGLWPAHGPFYTDIAVDEVTGDIWTRRRADATSEFVDVYSLDGGYQGSFLLPAGRFPVRLRAGQAYAVSNDSEDGIVVYSLRTLESRTGR
jgi:hypothetical protein